MLSASRRTIPVFAKLFNFFFAFNFAILICLSYFTDILLTSESSYEFQKNENSDKDRTTIQVITDINKCKTTVMSNCDVLIKILRISQKELDTVKEYS